MGIGLLQQLRQALAGGLQLARRAAAGRRRPMRSRRRRDAQQGPAAKLLPAPPEPTSSAPSPADPAGARRPRRRSSSSWSGSRPPSGSCCPRSARRRTALYKRATRPGRTLHAMDGDLDRGGTARSTSGSRRSGASRRTRSATGGSRCSSGRRARSLELESRNGTGGASHLESCVLAMQNVRFDLLRLQSAGVARGAGRPHQATQQARALSRDVDNADRRGRARSRKAMEPLGALVAFLRSPAQMDVDLRQDHVLELRRVGHEGVGRRHPRAPARRARRSASSAMRAAISAP